MTGKIPILEAARAGLDHGVRTLGWSAVAAALVGAPAGAAAWVSLGRTADKDPLGALGWTVLSAVLTLPFLTAHLRTAVRAEPFRLSLGLDELRVLSAQAALIAFSVIVAVIGLFFSLFLMFALIGVAGVTLPAQGEADPASLQAALGPRGMLAASLAFLPLLLALTWIALRLFLVNAATIGAKRVRVFETWGWTKGNAWGLLACTLLLSAPAVLLLSGAVALLQAMLGIDGAVPAAMLGLRGLVLQCVNSVLTMLLLLGPLSGLSGYLYRGLRPD